MRWGWTRFLNPGNLGEGKLKDEQKDRNDISFKLAQLIISLQFRIAAYLNIWASGKSARQIRIMLGCLLVAAGGYCLYLICASLALLVK